MPQRHYLARCSSNIGLITLRFISGTSCGCVSLPVVRVVARNRHRNAEHPTLTSNP